MSGLEDAVLEEFDGPDQVSREMALRLVQLAAGPGVGGVAAIRALAELVAAQREDGPAAYGRPRAVS